MTITPQPQAPFPTENRRVTEPPASLPELKPTVQRTTEMPISEAQMTRAAINLWNLFAYILQDNLALKAATQELQEQLMHWPQGFDRRGEPTRTQFAPAASPDRTNDHPSEKQEHFYLELCRAAANPPTPGYNNWTVKRMSDEIEQLRRMVAGAKMDRNAGATDAQIRKYLATCGKLGVAPEAEAELRELSRGQLSDMIDGLISQLAA